MNSLKTLVIVTMLAAVGYAVYVSITRNPRQNDNGAAPAWSGTGKTAATANSTNGGAAPSATGPSVSLPGSTIPTASIPGNASPLATTPPSGLPLAGTVVPPPPTSPSGVGMGAPTAVPLTPIPGGTAPPAYPAPPPGYPAIQDKPGTPATAAADAGVSPEVMAQFGAFIADVQTKLDEGKLDEGLRALSMVYNKPDIPPPAAKQLHSLLDQLAGTVIYSRKHLLERPYVVQPGDRLDVIAQKYSVPWELLQRINGIRNPEQLTPGQELKVVRGPFSAVVNLERYEMTIFLQDRYAGRFPIGIGRDQLRLEGSYEVRDKILDPIYSNGDTSFGPRDPNNPFGRFLIALDNQVAIHGTNDARQIGRTDSRGIICLSDKDIDDVFGILSIGSKITIQR